MTSHGKVSWEFQIWGGVYPSVYPLLVGEIVEHSLRKVLAIVAEQTVRCSHKPAFVQILNQLAESLPAGSVSSDVFEWLAPNALSSLTTVEITNVLEASAALNGDSLVVLLDRPPIVFRLENDEQMIENSHGQLF